MTTIPPHIAAALLNDQLPWQLATHATFPVLFEAYSFHDSELLATQINYSQETVLVISLDAHWNLDRLPLGAEERDWPFLLVKIPRLLQLGQDPTDEANILSTANSSEIPTQEVQDWLKAFDIPDNGNRFRRVHLLPKEIIHRTILTNIYGLGTELLHGAEILVLLLQSTGEQIALQLQPRTYAEPQKEKRSLWRSLAFWRKGE